MVDVRAWLNGLGLGQYAAAFADSDVDAAALGALRSADLRKLGVESLAHRRILLAAIKDLASGITTSRRLPGDDLPP